MKSIKLSDYIELVKPHYIYIRITPHKSIRNYNSSNVAKAIAHTYKSINARIKKEQNKLFFETNFKVSYIIDIQKNDVGFYFLIPQFFKNIITEKILEIWNKATIEEVPEIKSFTNNSISYQLAYKKEDALSITVDKKSNEPLNNILNVIDIMKDDDRITIVYNFLPVNQFGWQKQYADTIKKFKDNKPLDKEKSSTSYILKTGFTFIISLIDSVLELFVDFTGGNKNTTDTNILEAVATLLSEGKELSSATKKKKEATVLNTQIAIVSDSVDKTRQENNVLAVCQSYRVLDEDNELIYKKAKTPNIQDFSFSKYDVNTVSTDECQNFIQVPARELLKNYNINHVKTFENPLPLELRQGTKFLGDVKVQGNTSDSYLEDDYDIGNLPLVAIGSQGGGKTTYLSNYSSYCSQNDESVIVIDFIKNCELSEKIKKYTEKDRLVEIDLGQQTGIQGLGYNEIIIDKSMSSFDRLKLASIQSQQVMSLVDAISTGDPLSSRMRRYLNAASTVVFALGHNSVRNVVECLEDFRKREKFINELSVELKEMLEDEVNTLLELDEWSKATKDNPSVKIGTKETKIEHIQDRISLLREDFKLKYMFNKPLKDNINLVDCMEQGKVVSIKMKESDFPTKMAKNIMVTYWISKVWLASQLRGMLHEKPTRTNIIIDEIFQAPTAMTTLDYVLPQSRKFGCKFVFSTQYINQLDTIFDALEASGASYMLLKGCLENDFNHFKSKLGSFEFEDLRDMEQYNSLNLIYYSKGYASFISKLPKP